MNDNRVEKINTKKANSGTGIAIGAAIGVSIGPMYNQLALGLAVGTALGAVWDFGEMLWHQRTSKA